MGASFSITGDFSETEKWLRSLNDMKLVDRIDSIASKGVAALAKATPVDTGQTASKWSYQIKQVKDGFEVAWTNSATAGDAPVVILLQYGHGTGTGGYVPGRDFINPVMKPIFDSISSELRKAVRGK